MKYIAIYDMVYLRLKLLFPFPSLQLHISISLRHLLIIINDYKTQYHVELIYCMAIRYDPKDNESIIVKYGSALHVIPQRNYDY